MIKCKFKRINSLEDIDMAAKFKKFFLAVVTVVLGAMSSGGIAQAQTNTGVTVPGYGVYDFSLVYGNFTANSAVLQSQPWWSSSSIANTFASAGGNFGASPDFAYSVSKGNFYSYYNDSSIQPNNAPVDYYNVYGFATASCSSGCAAVPEIDGALIPQVGLLLAGLFIILGRRKENIASI